VVHEVYLFVYLLDEFDPERDIVPAVS